MSALTAFLSLGEVIASAESVREAVEAIRQGIPDDEWEELISAQPLVEALWDACVDLEGALQRD